MEKKKIVFLYRELATYFLACIEKLLEREDVEVYLFHWEVNREAPFTFVFPDKLKRIERNNYSDDQVLEMVSEISPSIIVSSGWTDKGYLKICKKFKDKIPTVLILDNQWQNNFKQKLACFLSPFFIRNKFSHCWVPGRLQEEYATHLGFPKQNIIPNYYSCDFDLFYNLFKSNRETKINHFPKRFIFVGRYYEFKGINDLWNAFIQLQNEFPNDWELWCLGTGDIKPIQHTKIKHFGFVQPKDMAPFIKDSGVFILPSHFEPWGVVVHEFAAAGFPLILSDVVGARYSFVKDNYNGFVYKSESVNELKATMKQIILKSNRELFEMGERSVKKAKQITPDKWVQGLLAVIANKN